MVHSLVEGHCSVYFIFGVELVLSKTKIIVECTYGLKIWRLGLISYGKYLGNYTFFS